MKHLRTLFFVVLVLFIFQGCSTNRKAYQSGKWKTKETFPIEITVDFGPAGKPTHQETLYIEKHTTPKDAVSQIFPIMSGKACCSLKEIMEIGGVRIDPAKNRWWKAKVNGSDKLSPHKKILKEGDHLSWTYITESQ